MRRAAVMLPAAPGLAVAGAPARPGRTRTAPAAPAWPAAGARPARPVPCLLRSGVIALPAWLPGAPSFAGGSMILRRSRQLDPRLFQIASLGTLLAANIAWFDFGARPGQSVVMLLAQAGFCRLFAVPLDWRSPLVTGLSLSLLLRTNLPPLWMAAPVLAIGSKFLLRVRGKHVFNPAAFAIAVGGARRWPRWPGGMAQPRISSTGSAPASRLRQPNQEHHRAPHRRLRHACRPQPRRRRHCRPGGAEPELPPRHRPGREQVHPPLGQVSAPLRNERGFIPVRSSRVRSPGPGRGKPGCQPSLHTHSSMRCAAVGLLIPRPPRGSVPRA